MAGTSACNQFSVTPALPENATCELPQATALSSPAPGPDGAVLAWRRRRSVSTARIGKVDPAGIEVVRVTKRATFFRLHQAGIDGSDVIAARMSQRRGRIEQTVYEQLLPKLNVAVPRYYGSSTDDDSGIRWVFTEDAGGEKYSPRDPGCRVAAARWLAALHAGAASAEHDLRNLDLPEHGEPYYREHLLAAVDKLTYRLHDPLIGPLLSDANVGPIHFLLDACALTANRWDEVSSLVAAAPRTIVHGDAAPRNFRFLPDRNPVALLGFDWEDVAWAPPAIDLIHADPHATCDALNPDLDAYLAATAWPGMDRERMRRSGEIGRLFWYLLAIRLDAEAMSLDCFERRLSNLRLYAAELFEVFRELGWPAPTCHFDRGASGVAHE